jgi:hypothetical protein
VLSSIYIGDSDPAPGQKRNPAKQRAARRRWDLDAERKGA